MLSSMSYVVSEIFGSKTLVILNFPGTERKRKSALVQSKTVKFNFQVFLLNKWSSLIVTTKLTFCLTISQTKDNKISVSCLKD